MADSLKLTQGQASDLEAASDAVYSAAADTVIGMEAGLGRDLTALLTIFFIVVMYHIQNPLLQFEVTFGKAFRNPSLQAVLAVALLIGAAVLITRGKPFAARAWRA